MLLERARPRRGPAAGGRERRAVTLNHRWLRSPPSVLERHEGVVVDLDTRPAPVRLGIDPTSAGRTGPWPGPRGGCRGRTAGRPPRRDRRAPATCPGLCSGRHRSKHDSKRGTATRPRRAGGRTVRKSPSHRRFWKTLSSRPRLSGPPTATALGSAGSGRHGLVEAPPAGRRRARPAPAVTWATVGRRDPPQGRGRRPPENWSTASRHGGVGVPPALACSWRPGSPGDDRRQPQARGGRHQRGVEHQAPSPKPIGRDAQIVAGHCQRRFTSCRGTRGCA